MPKRIRSAANTQELPKAKRHAVNPASICYANSVRVLARDVGRLEARRHASPIDRLVVRLVLECGLDR